MKLSKETLNILKNFSAINSNLLIKPGNKLSTLAVVKNIMAEVDVSETFTKEAGIFNLSEFLGVVSLMEDPDISFESKYMVLKENNDTYRYIYSDPSLLVYPTKSINLPNPDVNVTLTAAVINRLQRAASTLSLADVAIIGDGKKVIAKMTDKKVTSANEYTVDLETDTDKTFTAYFKIENFKLIPDDYEVDLSSKNISRFVGKASKVTYYIAMESDSVF